MKPEENTAWGKLKGEKEIFYFQSKLGMEENIKLLDVESDDLSGLDDLSAIYLYISQKKDCYYIGQTNLFSRRHKEHTKEEKDGELRYQTIFSDGHVIIFYGLEISRNLNYIEQRLIKIFQEMSPINGFELLNNTNGNKSDFLQENRENSDLKVIKNILITLKDKELIRFDIELSTKTLQSLLFRTSPFFELSEGQEKVVKAVTENDDKYKTFIIKGGAGTGKTITMNHMISEFIRLNREKKMKEEPLINIAVCLKSNMVDGVNKMFKVYEPNLSRLSIKIDSWYNILQYEESFDYIIVDEAQRLLKPHSSNYPELHRKYLRDKNQDALNLLINKSEHLVLFYDPYQKIRPSDIDPIKKDENGLYNYSFKEGNHIFERELKVQYRIKAGSTKLSKDFVTALKDILEIEDAPKDFKTSIFKETNYFDLIDSGSFDESLRGLKGYIDKKVMKFPKKNSRIIAGYSRDISKQQAKNKKQQKKEAWFEIGMEWNKYYKIWATKRDKNGGYLYQNEVGAIHSVQGYDFDYIGVIIGKDIIYKDGKIKISKNDYKDRKGKSGLNDDKELLDYIKQAYYVLLTRGIYGIRIVIEDDALRTHFKEKIEEYSL